MMAGGSAGAVRMNVDVYGNVRPLERSIRRAAGAFSTLGGQSLRPLGAGLSAATVQASEFTKSIEASNARVLAFGASAGVIYGLVRAMKELVTATISVEKAMAEVNVLVNETEPGLKKLRHELFEVSKMTGQSFAVVADAAKEFARQGLTAKEMLTRVKDAMILTRLSGIDAADAVKTITAALNTFRKEAMKSSEVVNKMANVDAAFAVSMKDLSDSISRAGAVAASTGVKFNQLMGMVASAQQQTARGGKVIGNALKTIMIKVERPRMIQYMEDLGIKTRATANTMKYAKGQLLDFHDRLTNLSKAYHGMQTTVSATTNATMALNSVQRSQIDLWAGGLYQVNILKALLQDYAAEQGIAAKATKVAADAEEEAYERLYRLQKTLDHAVQGTKSTLTELGRVIGELGVDDLLQDVLQTIMKVSGWLSKLVGSSTGWGKAVKSVFKGVGDFLAGPGFAAAVVLIGKFLGYFVIQGAQALASMVGITSAAGRRAAIEKQVAAILSTETQLIAQVLNGEVSRAAASQQVLNTLTAQTATMQLQRSLLASTMGVAGAGGMFRRGGGAPRMGMDTVNRNITVTGGAGQGIPNFALKASMEDILVAARAEAAAGYTPMLGYNKQAGGLMIYGKEQGSAANAVRQHLAAGQSITEARTSSFRSQKGGRKKVPHFEPFVMGPMAMGMGMLAMGGMGGMGQPSELQSLHKKALDDAKKWSNEQARTYNTLRTQKAEMMRMTGRTGYGGGTVRIGGPEVGWARQRQQIAGGAYGTGTSNIDKMLKAFDKQVGTERLKGQYNWLKGTGMLGTGATVQGATAGGAWTYGTGAPGEGPKHTELKGLRGGKLSADIRKIEQLRGLPSHVTPPAGELRKLEAHLRQQVIIAERALVSQYGNAQATALMHDETRRDAQKNYNEQQRQTKALYRPMDDRGRLGNLRFSGEGAGHQIGKYAGVGMIAGPVLGNIIADQMDDTTRAGAAKKEMVKGAGSTVGYAAMGYMFTQSSPWGAAIGAAVGMFGMVTKTATAMADATHGMAGEIERARLVADNLSSALTNAATHHEEYSRGLRDSGISERTLMRLRVKFADALGDAIGKVTDPKQLEQLRAASGNWEDMQTVMGQIAKDAKKEAVQKQTGKDLITYKQEQKSWWKKTFYDVTKTIAYVAGEGFDTIMGGSLDFDSISEQSQDEQNKFWEHHDYSGTIYKGTKGRRQLQSDAQRMFETMRYRGGMRQVTDASGKTSGTMTDFDVQHLLQQSPEWTATQMKHGWGGIGGEMPEEFKEFLSQLDHEDMASFGLAFQELIRTQEHGTKVAESYSNHLEKITEIQRKANAALVLMSKDLDKSIRSMLMLQSRLSRVFGGRQDIMDTKAANARDVKLKTAQMAASTLNPFLSPEQKARQQFSLETSRTQVDFTTGMEKTMTSYSKDMVAALQKHAESLSKDTQTYFKEQLKQDAKAEDNARIRMQKSATQQNSMLLLTGEIATFLQGGGDPAEVAKKIEEFMKLPMHNDLAVHLPALQAAIYAQTDTMEINLLKLVEQMSKANDLNDANYRFQVESIRIQRNLEKQGGIKTLQKDLYGGAKTIAAIVGGTNADLGSGMGGGYEGWDSQMLKGQQLAKMTDLFKNYFGGQNVPQEIKDKLVQSRAMQMAATAREYNLSVDPSQRLPGRFETGMGNMEAAEDQVANMLQEGIPERLTHIKEEIISLQTEIKNEHTQTQGKMQKAHEDAIKNVLHNGSNTILRDINATLLLQDQLRKQMNLKREQTKLKTEDAAMVTRRHEIGLNVNNTLEKMHSLMIRSNVMGKADMTLEGDKFHGRGHRFQQIWDPAMDAGRNAGKRYTGKWTRDPTTNQRVIDPGATSPERAAEAADRYLFHMMIALQDRALSPAEQGETGPGLLRPKEEHFEQGGMYRNLWTAGDDADDTADDFNDLLENNPKVRGMLLREFRRKHAADPNSKYFNEGPQGMGQEGGAWRDFDLATRRARGKNVVPSTSAPFEHYQDAPGVGITERFNQKDWESFSKNVDVEAMLRELLTDYRGRLERQALEGGLDYGEIGRLSDERALMDELSKTLTDIFHPLTGITSTAKAVEEIDDEYKKQAAVIKTQTERLDKELAELAETIKEQALKLSGDKKAIAANAAAKAERQEAAKAQAILDRQAKQKADEKAAEDRQVKRAEAEIARRKAMEGRGKGLGFAEGGAEQYAFRTFLQDMGLADQDINKSGLMGMSQEATQMYRHYVQQGVDGKQLEAEMAAAISQSLLEAEGAGYKIEETFNHVVAALASLRNRLDFKSGRKSGAQYAAGVNQTMQGKVDRGTFNIQRDFGELFTGQFARNYKTQMQEMKDLVVDLAATMKSEMKDAFKSWMSGAMSAKEAMASMISGIFEKLLDKGIDAGINSLFSMTMGPSREKGGNRVWAQGGYIPKYARGGKVTGGSGYDDDVLAYMQGGEFVFKKAAAQRMGYGNLDRLQSMAEGGKIPGFSRGGRASFTGAQDILFDDEKKPSKMKMVRDPMMSALSMDKESQNPQIQKYYERESKWYDYMNYMHERAQAHAAAMKKFNKQQKNRLIGAAINAALIIAGGAAQASANASAAAAAGPAPAGASGAAASGAQIGSGAGQAASGVAGAMGQTAEQMGQPTGLLGKMFGTTLGRTLTFGAAGALTGALTAGEDESKGEAAFRMGLGGGLAGFASGMADISIPKWDRERRQKENAKKLAQMRTSRGTSLTSQQQRTYVGGSNIGIGGPGKDTSRWGRSPHIPNFSDRRRITSGGAIVSPGFGTAGSKLSGQGGLTGAGQMRGRGGGVFGRSGNKKQRLLYEPEWWEGMTLAQGGPIEGTSAEVHPAMLMGGEFVLNRDAVENMKRQGQGLSFLNQMNRGGVSPQFAQDGGLVGKDFGGSAAGSASGDSNLDKLIQITEEVKAAITHGNELQEKSPNDTSSTKSENRTGGGGGLVNNINISVSVDGNGKANSNSSSNSQGQGGGGEAGSGDDMTRKEAEQFSTMIESKVVEVISREQRPYGLLAKEKYE